MIDVHPRVRAIPRDLRNRSLDDLRKLALGDSPNASDANECYWVARFDHPLLDHVQIKGFLSREWKYAKALTAAEKAALTSSDLAVLATSPSEDARQFAAGHKLTPPSSLSLLSADSSAHVRKAAGHNFATPPEAIERMLRQGRPVGHWDEISPVRVSWLWAESESAALDPEVALKVASGFAGDDTHRLALARRQRVPLAIRRKLAGSYKISQPVAEILAKDPDATVREAVARNYQTPPEVLRRLLRDKISDVRAAAGAHPDLPEDAYRALLASDDRAVVTQVVATRGYTNGELEQLSRSSDAEVRAAAAWNRGASVAVLETLAEDEDESVRAAVESVLGYESANALYRDYQRPFIWWYRREFGPVELSALAHSSSARLRSFGAPRLGNADDLHTLADDRDPRVRGAAATNPRLSFVDLVKLANDTDEGVRGSTANAVANQLEALQEPPATTENWLNGVDDIHPDLPLETYGSESRIESRRLQFGYPWMRPRSWSGQDLTPLATARSEGVRQAVAGYNGSFDSLSDSSRSYYRFDPVLTPDALLALLTDSSSTVRETALRNSGQVATQIAAHPDTPGDVLSGLARSKSANVRAAVARNPAAAGPVLANLARDPEPSVLVALASNPSTPAGTIGQLTSDSRDEVLLELLSNPRAPAEFLAHQSALPYDWHEPDRHRRLAANPNTPADVLRRIAYSRIADVRAAVAANVNTPVDSLEILALDENEQVRGAARRALGDQ